MNFVVQKLSGGSYDSINLAYVVRAEWSLAAGGYDGNLQLHLVGGQLRNIPFGAPEFPVFAEALGFKAQLEAWPKQQAAAKAAALKAKQERDAQKARQQQRRVA